VRTARVLFDGVAYARLQADTVPAMASQEEMP
jgi:hypothetical protein